jgi:hypothetical protein
VSGHAIDWQTTAAQNNLPLNSLSEELHFVITRRYNMMKYSNYNVRPPQKVRNAGNAGNVGKDSKHSNAGYAGNAGEHGNAGNAGKCSNAGKDSNANKCGIITISG